MRVLNSEISFPPRILFACGLPSADVRAWTLHSPRLLPGFSLREAGPEGRVSLISSGKRATCGHQGAWE